tara:strand:- start:520 stop:1560 length:1041 start_codon:yes stop_codon:yes gene_type:complete
MASRFLRCCAQREKPRNSHSDGLPQTRALHAQRTYKWEGGLKILSRSGDGSPRDSSNRKTSGASAEESMRPSLHFLEPEEFHKALLAGWVDIATVGAGEQTPSRKTKWKRKWVAVWKDHLGWYELGREEGRVQFLPTESAVCELPDSEGVLLCRSTQAGDSTAVFVSCETVAESKEWVVKIDGALTVLNERHASSKRAEQQEAARAQRELTKPRGSLWEVWSMQSLMDLVGGSSGSNVTSRAKLDEAADSGDSAADLRRISAAGEAQEAEERAAAAKRSAAVAEQSWKQVVAEESNSRKSAAEEERKRNKWGGGGSLTDIFASFKRGGGGGGGGKELEAQSMSGQV